MDLNIVINENGQISDEVFIQKRIYRAFHDRFKAVALNTIIEGDKAKNIPKPLNIKCRNSKMKIFNRLTVKVSQNMQIFNLQKNDNFKKYDIFAIEPMNEQILNQINSGDIHCDILTFSTTDLLKVIKKSNFALTIERNIGIEINYSGMLSSASDRRQTIAFGQLLVDKTRSKGIIISSGTKPEMTSKTPQDIMAICSLFGLANNQINKALFVAPQDVIKRSELRRNIITSIIKTNDNENDNKDNEKTNKPEMESIMKRKLDCNDVVTLKKIKC